MDALEDLDFADDIVLLAHRHQDIQRKTIDVAIIGRQVRLNINTDKNQTNEDQCKVEPTGYHRQQKR